MQRETRLQFHIVRKEETKLYRQVMELNTNMRKCQCDCDNPVKRDFRNIAPLSEHSIYCLNCGGYIIYNEKD